jgi:hypothetical protein
LGSWLTPRKRDRVLLPLGFALSARIIAGLSGWRHEPRGNARTGKHAEREEPGARMECA